MQARRAGWQAEPVNQLRCVIVDDDASFLEAAQILLESDGVTVTGTASSCADALVRVDALQPDVVLIDIRLGEESGFDVARRLADGEAAAELIMISTHAEADYADLIAESPTAGFLPKTELSGTAIRRIIDGK
jgi:DNA-binding NarL/FixJ family response regulator